MDPVGKGAASTESMTTTTTMTDNNNNNDDNNNSNNQQQKPELQGPETKAKHQRKQWRSGYRNANRYPRHASDGSPRGITNSLLITHYSLQWPCSHCIAIVKFFPQNATFAIVLQGHCYFSLATE